MTTARDFSLQDGIIVLPDRLIAGGTLTIFYRRPPDLRKARGKRKIQNVILTSHDGYDF
ncbi:hypothetical protein E308F_27750 [Moorella sp. E308F]|uniref:hypothetical protein n=1 Tax=unclassified Neomoorella TaxID=2676739 RepID=UPI0010FFB604|nr:MULTISPECIES: hypothetical protein [unclassified Moorella (in: firmicutes)]GEA16529.1 hypothetical protein E308F_27750 [Moorella sp. E308F]GEA17276.1 hypothetical protein E306M_04100 [Moorella sp. E306M]